MEASLEEQTVTVEHADSVTPEELLAAISKWAESAGKKTSIREQ